MIAGCKPDLLAGERVEWQGKPYTGLIVRPIDVFLIPFSLFWCGFALFWNVSVWTTNAELPFKFFGLPFIVAGIYVTLGRFLIDMGLRRNLTYYVTNQRVLISKQRGVSKVKSLDIQSLPPIELEERGDGSGTIRFGGSSGWFSGNNFGLWQPTSDPTPQLIRIPKVRSVYQLIQKQSDR